MEFAIPEIPSCLDAHPSSELAVIGCVDGCLHLVSYSKKECADCDEPSTSSGFHIRIVHSFQHKAATRKAAFSRSGASVFCVTKNRALTEWDVESCKKKRCLRRAHPNAAPYALTVISESQIGTGDERGYVRLWDWRQPGSEPVAEFRETHEYITDMIADQDGRYLLATSGDALLTAFNVKSRQMELQSEPMHSELHCVGLTKGGRKVVCGGVDGYLEVFNFGEWGNITDRLETGHTESIEAIASIGASSGLIATGSSDGQIKLCHVLPNEVLDVIGQDEEGIDCLAVSYDDKWLLSCGFGGVLRFWDMEKVVEDVPVASTGATFKRWKKERKACNPFFTELDDIKE